MSHPLSIALIALIIVLTYGRIILTYWYRRHAGSLLLHMRNPSWAWRNTIVGALLYGVGMLAVALTASSPTPLPLIASSLIVVILPSTLKDWFTELWDEGIVVAGRFFPWQRVYWWEVRMIDNECVLTVSAHSFFTLWPTTIHVHCQQDKCVDIQRILANRVSPDWNVSHHQEMKEKRP